MREKSDYCASDQSERDAFKSGFRPPCTRSFLIQRRGQSPIHRPAFDDPLPDRVHTQPCKLRGLRYRHRTSLEDDKASAAAVSSLRRLRGPSTIPRLVIPIVFNAIQRVCRAGARTHILEKRKERPAPPIANADPPTPVVGERPVPRVQTARTHVSPCMPLGRTVMAMLASPGFDPKLLRDAWSLRRHGAKLHSAPPSRLGRVAGALGDQPDFRTRF